MKFCVSKSQQINCAHIINELRGRSLAVDVIGQGGKPRMNGEVVCTLVAVPELARTGHWPGQIRLIDQGQLTNLGGTLPWQLGKQEQVLAVAPSPTFSKADRGAKRVFAGNLRRQVDIALQAAEQRANVNVPAK